MTTRFSDDGRYFWDGHQWQPAISADGRWRWDGTQWTANTRPSAADWPRALRIGSWIGGGVAVLLFIFCLIALLIGTIEATQGDHSAGSSFGVALIALSLAVLFASPLGIRWTLRRGLVVAGSAVATVLFLGTCGGGFALIAAFPAPTPSPSIVSRNIDTAPSPLPSAAAQQPSQSPSPPSSPSIPPTPSPPPPPPLAPSPRQSPSPSPTQLPATTPRPPPPTSPPAADTCGAPANPWGYNFCGRGALIYSPPADFCSYFSPCVSKIWTP